MKAQRAATATLILLTSWLIVHCPGKTTGGTDTSPQPMPQPFALKIGDFYHAADGCQSTARHLEVDIPHPQMLNVGYQGVVAGIQFRETTKVASAGYRNVSFNGGKLSFDLYADGPGTRQRVPCPTLTDPLRTCDACTGGSGASIGYEITAHYSQRPPGV